MPQSKLSKIEDAIADFREGKFVIVVDDEDRENEGDLIIAAEMITPEKVNFMLKHAAECSAHRLHCRDAPNSTCHTRWRTTHRCSAHRLP